MDGSSPTHSGAQLTFLSQEGQTPLIAAVVNGHTQLALGLVQGFGADINAADSSGRTALSEAARRGDTTALAGLVAAGTRLDGPRLLKEGWTALHVAAAGGHEAATTWLVSSGADLWTKDNVSAAKNVAQMKLSICLFSWTVSLFQGVGLLGSKVLRLLSMQPALYHPSSRPKGCLNHLSHPCLRTSQSTKSSLMQEGRTAADVALQSGHVFLYRKLREAGSRQPGPLLQSTLVPSHTPMTEALDPSPATWAGASSSGGGIAGAPPIQPMAAARMQQQQHDHTSGQDNIDPASAASHSSGIYPQMPAGAATYY